MAADVDAGGVSGSRAPKTVRQKSCGAAGIASGRELSQVGENRNEAV